VIGGDVALGPLPAQTLDEVAALGTRARFVLGNSDREVVDAFDRRHADRWAAFTAGQISRVQRDFLASFASTIELDVDGLGSTLFCHGSPRSDTENITLITSDDRLREVLGGVEQPVVVCGHTHQQFDRTIDGRRVINAGSVGLPYEGRPGAYWALLGPEVSLRRSDYDLDEALTELRAGGFPDLDELLKESLLDPIGPGEVAQIFERQALEGG